MSDESIDRSLVTLLGAVLHKHDVPEAEILLQLVAAAGFGHDLETRLAAWIEAAEDGESSTWRAPTGGELAEQIAEAFRKVKASATEGQLSEKPLSEEIDRQLVRILSGYRLDVDGSTLRDWAWRARGLEDKAKATEDRPDTPDEAEHPDAEFRSDEPPLDVAMRRIGFLERDIRENYGPIKRPTNEDASRWSALVQGIREAVDVARRIGSQADHPDTARLRALAAAITGGEMRCDLGIYRCELTIETVSSSANVAESASRLSHERTLETIREFADALTFYTRPNN